MIIHEDDLIQIKIVEDDDFDFVIVFKSHDRIMPLATINLFIDDEMTSKRMAEFGVKIIEAVTYSLSEEDKKVIKSQVFQLLES
jgi:hypothetical protein